MKFSPEIKDVAIRDYRSVWNKKTTRQIKREIDSWSRYMAKHSGAYGWIETNPNELCDSDKLNILREILINRDES